ncbi:DUF4263 domain-containing protein [Chitiniphilus purpureus]|uniref:DUF4263 domain-containing protein n=1 Tax=Chitiniphilus purpureus TaxID=2981137 RepID=A0ABY6DQJ5_9NEIS|nr:Shedu immune nuclease family protein [Chitiniphilus sp. CD1]UXY16645.1 DUF4263 domain-containing protein [Chitiniphilus sp. CD1]
MPSLSRTEYNQLKREDGGPFLFLDSDIHPETLEELGVVAYFSDVSFEQDGFPEDAKPILYVTPEALEIYPINVKKGTSGYLASPYGRIEKIVVARRKDYSFDLPNALEEVDDLLAQLPAGFSKNWRSGLGFKWEYRFICEYIEKLGVSILAVVIDGGDSERIDGQTYYLPLSRFHWYRKQIDQITNRARSIARARKDYLFYNEILGVHDSANFPPKPFKPPLGVMAALTGGGETEVQLSASDKKTVVQIVADNVEELAAGEPARLLQLKEDIEMVTLSQLIEQFSSMLEKLLDETRWQSFFAKNPFVLSLAFSVPFVLFQKQAYAGGKRVDGKGGKHPDFIYSAEKTGNLAIVEIKKPSTPLLGACYREPDVYAPSAELVGGVAQILSQRLALRGSLADLKDVSNRYDIQGYSTPCIVVAGSTPTEREKQRGFELYRHALTDVSIITFDELLARLVAIRDALKPPGPESKEHFDLEPPF